MTNRGRGSGSSPRGAGVAVAPRERILNAASRLFGHRGAIHTGVDTVIAEAGVAKATFYRHFPSKEALVVAWLHSPDTRWFDHVRDSVEAERGDRTPVELVPVLFGEVASWLESGEYAGCPYLNTAIEAPHAGKPTKQACREYLAEIRAYLEALARSAGHPEPARAGRQLQATLAGAITLGVAHGTNVYVLDAMDVARGLLAVG